MVEINQEERVGSLLSQYTIIFYIYVGIVELIFIRFARQYIQPCKGKKWVQNMVTFQ